MKMINIKNTALVVALSSLAITGCKKSDFAINKEPVGITESTVDYRAVLTASQSSTANLVANQWRFLQHWMGYWARSGSYQTESTIEMYQFTNDFSNTIWTGFYNNASNYNTVIKKANAAGAGTYEAIARILKAHAFQYLVDVYGNIPYSEALQGTAPSTPKYDDDAAIYEDLLRELDKAIVILKNPDVNNANVNPEIATKDVIFKGNNTSWIKFANTLKLRLLMHMSSTEFTATGAEVNSYVPGSNVPAEIAIILAEGTGFLGAGESANFNPGYLATKPNPFYRNYVKSESGTTASAGDVSKANIYAVGKNNDGYYQVNGDPRVDRFYIVPTGATVHRGITFGENSGVDPNNVGAKLSFIYGPGYLPNGAESRAWIFTSVESLFLQAEAIYRGLLPGNAKTALTAAVRESFVWLGLTSAQADTYIAGNATWPDVDIDGIQQEPNQPKGGMYTILSQKWFALNGIATLEIWTDFRRSDIKYGAAVGYDAGPPISVVAPANRQKIPVRLFYPQAEYNYNSVNVSAEGTIDVANPAAKNKIFWDLK